MSTYALCIGQVEHIESRHAAPTFTEFTCLNRYKCELIGLALAYLTARSSIRAYGGLGRDFTAIDPNHAGLQIEHILHSFRWWR